MMTGSGSANRPTRQHGQGSGRACALLLGASLLLGATAAPAFPIYYTLWNNTYPASQSGERAGGEGCQLCHWTTAATWNAYGNALKTLVQGGISITIAFTLVAGSDSDQDPGQADNVSEINASTQPGWTSGGNNPVYNRTGNVIATVAPPLDTQPPYDPGAAPLPPVADPGGPYAAAAGATVLFDGSGSSDPDGGAIVAYDWDFGDGGQGSGVTPTHVYAGAATYTVTLTVTDDQAQQSAPATTTAVINPVDPPDDDNDGVENTQDNCIDRPNGPLIPDAGGFSQRDTDGDGFGNVCDADLNGDGVIDLLDFVLLRNGYGQSGELAADLDGDGAVNLLDFILFRGDYGGAPGPSCCAP
ncbi:MAG: PKD domain-containing protein [Pseudomonadota bacterium]